jgi:hypothetical protein
VVTDRSGREPTCRKRQVYLQKRHTVESGTPTASCVYISSCGYHPVGADSSHSKSVVDHTSRRVPQRVTRSYCHLLPARLRSPPWSMPLLAIMNQ